MPALDRPVITQLCLIVSDVEPTAARYAEILGFTPAPLQISEGEKHVTLNIGQLQFVILEPQRFPSRWQEFRSKYGRGIQHIGFSVPDVVATGQPFTAYGYHLIQQGQLDNHPYGYLNTDKDMGIVMALTENGSPAQSSSFPADQGIGTDVITQVAMVVHNIEQAATRYSEVFGLPQPPIITTAGYALSKTMFEGKPSEATAKLAFFEAGQVTIELIEPDQEPSVWRNHLNQHGESAQHIAFQIKDTQRITDHFGRFGIPVIQQGLYSDGSGMYTYLGSEADLGVTIELLENF